VDALYVVGAGGIGCAIGYSLAAAGARVIFVDTDPEKVQWGKTHGVRVGRKTPQSAEFLIFEDWNPSADATVFLCTKCYDNAAVLARLRDSITVIPVQNGFDPALEARRHACEGIASYVSECHSHRPHTRITRAGRLHIGSRYPGAGSLAFEWVDRLRRASVFATTQVPEILPYKYTKLMYNAAISSVAAMAGLDNGQLLWILKARRLFFALLRENYAVLKNSGITLGKIGPFHPDTVNRILQRKLLANALAWAFYPSLRGSYCSKSGDLPKGKTEIDYYNGRLIQLAGNYPCPFNRAVYGMVKRMEREKIPPGLSVLDEVVVGGGL
jgi:2-dehydropantoate 2-reductase